MENVLGFLHKLDTQCVFLVFEKFVLSCYNEQLFEVRYFTKKAM